MPYNGFTYFIGDFEFEVYIELKVVGFIQVVRFRRLFQNQQLAVDVFIYSLSLLLYMYLHPPPPLKPTVYQQIIACAVDLTNFLPFLLRYKLYRIQHCVRLALRHSETSIEGVLGVTARSLKILKEFWASRCAPPQDPEGVFGVTARSLKILKEFWASRCAPSRS